jgi:hypothetical protein
VTRTSIVIAIALAATALPCALVGMYAASTRSTANVHVYKAPN